MAEYNGWRNDCVVKAVVALQRTCHRFTAPSWRLTMSGTPTFVSGHPTPYSVHFGHQTCMCCTDICEGKTFIYIKYISFFLNDDRYKIFAFLLKVVPPLSFVM